MQCAPRRSRACQCQFDGASTYPIPSIFPPLIPGKCVRVRSGKRDASTTSARADIDTRHLAISSMRSILPYNVSARRTVEQPPPVYIAVHYVLLQEITIPLLSHLLYTPILRGYGP